MSDRRVSPRSEAALHPEHVRLRELVEWCAGIMLVDPLETVHKDEFQARADELGILVPAAKQPDGEEADTVLAFAWSPLAAPGERQ